MFLDDYAWNTNISLFFILAFFFTFLFTCIENKVIFGEAHISAY